MSEPYHEFVNSLFNNSQDIIKTIIDNGIKNEKEININVWINALTMLMITVETYKQLNGSLKKRVVMEVCLKCIDQIDSLSIQNKFYIKNLIKITMPDIIDKIVEISININIKKKKFFGKIFTYCCPSPQKIPQPVNPEIVIEQPPQ